MTHLGNRRNQGTRTLSSPMQMLRMIERLALRTETPAKVLSSDLGWSSAKTHQYLTTAVAAGWVMRTENGYALSVRACALGNSASQRFGLSAELRASMTEACETLGEPISYAVLNGDSPQIIERVEPTRALHFRISLEQPMSIVTSASGSLLVAYLNRADREDLRRRIPELKNEDYYAYIRKQGHVVISGFWEGDEIEAVAVPVMIHGNCAGALSAITPHSRTAPEVMLNELGRIRDSVNRSSDKEGISK